MPSHPNYFPEKCPPVSAIDAQGKVYRIVKGEPLMHDDFLNYHEEGRPASDPCSRCGISLYSDFEYTVSLVRRNQKFGTSVAEGELNSSAGKVSNPSSSGHINWWPYEGIQRESYFSDVTSCEH